MNPTRIAARSAAAVLLCSVSAVALAAEPAKTTPQGPQTLRPDAALALTLEPVVVTAPRTSSPLTIETDPKAPRMPLPPNDGAGYLKSIPGFNVVRKGGIDGDPIFRGMSGSRLSVLIDGAPILGGCGGRMDPPTAYLFPEAFDRITVLKGPQSVIHGGGAAGATILVERNTERFDKPGVRGDLSILGGSWGRNDQVADVAAGSKEGYVRATGTRAHSDDYEDGAGNKVHSAYNRYSGSFLAGWTPDERTLLEASAEVSRAKAAYADRMMDGAKFDRTSYRLRFERSDLSPLVSKVKATVYYDYIDHVMDRFTLRKWSGGMMAALSNPDREDLGGRALVELKPADKLTLTLGADFNRDRHTARSLSAAEYLRGVDYRSKARTPDMAFDQWGGFLEGRYDLSAEQRVIAGYRLNHVETTRQGIANPPKDDDSLHNAFARYEHDVKLAVPTTFYVGLGHAQRAPDYWERMRNFALDNEKITQLDIGAIAKAEKWTGSLSLFANRTQDYIILSSTTGKNIDAVLLGGEAEISYALTKTWTIDASLAYVHGENTSDSKALPQMPPLEAKLGVRYDDGEFLGGALLRAATSQTRTDVGWGNIVGTDIGPTGGFATLSLNVGWRPTPRATLAAGVDNLFDKAYAESVSKASTNTLVSEGYVQTTRVNEPGRTFWVKGSLSF